MMISHVLAAVPVTDFDAVVDWYEQLLGRPADNRPMDGLADWHVTETGWIQVFRDAGSAGRTTVNVAVDSLDQVITELSDRGLAASDIMEATAGVRLAMIKDPDGNTITLVEQLRTDS